MLLKRSFFCLLVVSVAASLCQAADKQPVESQAPSDPSEPNGVDELPFVRGESLPRNVRQLQEGVVVFLQKIDKYIQNIYAFTCKGKETITHEQQKTRCFDLHFYWKRSKDDGVLVQIDVPELQQKCLVQAGMFYVLNQATQKTSAYNLAHTLLDAVFADTPQFSKRFPASQVILLALNPYRADSNRTNSDGVTPQQARFDTACVVLKRRDKSAPSLWLVFSLYEDTSLSIFNDNIKGDGLRIKALLGWSLKDAQGTTTQVSFDPATLRVNDPTALVGIPGLFERSFSNSKVMSSLPKPQSGRPAAEVKGRG